MKPLQYEFQILCCDNGDGYSIFGGVGLETHGYQEAIRRRAADGWRYAGFIPRRQQAEGFIEMPDLVFEREVPGR